MQKKLRGKAAQARWAECPTAHNGSRAVAKKARRAKLCRARPSPALLPLPESAPGGRRGALRC